MMVLTDCSDWTTDDSHNGFNDAGCIVGQVKTIDIGTDSSPREIDVKVDSIDSDGNMVIQIGLDLGDGIGQPSASPTESCGDNTVCCPEIVVDGWAANTPLTRDGCCHDRCIYKSDYYSNGPFYFSWNTYYNAYYMTALEYTCSDSYSISHYGYVQTDVGCPAPVPVPAPTFGTTVPQPVASPVASPTVGYLHTLAPIPKPTVGSVQSPVASPTVGPVQSPVPAPTEACPGGPCGWCFSARSTVMVRNSPNSNHFTATPLSEVHVGDEILMSAGSSKKLTFTRVESLPHSKTTQDTYRIEIKNSFRSVKGNVGNVLEATSFHTFPRCSGAGSLDHEVFAKDIKVGDCLLTLDGKKLVKSVKLMSTIKASQYETYSIVTSGGHNDVINVGGVFTHARVSHHLQ